MRASWLFGDKHTLSGTMCHILGLTSAVFPNQKCALYTGTVCGLLRIMHFGHISILVASQVPVGDWFSRFPDPTHADAILDCVIHNAYRLNLTGDSQRKAPSPHPHVVHMIYNFLTSVAPLHHWTP